MDQLAYKWDQFARSLILGGLWDWVSTSRSSREPTAPHAPESQGKVGVRYRRWRGNKSRTELPAHLPVLHGQKGPSGLAGVKSVVSKPTAMHIKAELPGDRNGRPISLTKSHRPATIKRHRDWCPCVALADVGIYQEHSNTRLQETFARSRVPEARENESNYASNKIKLNLCLHRLQKLTEGAGANKLTDSALHARIYAWLKDYVA